MQREVTSQHIIPFIEKVRPLKPGDKVIEIGCGEAGVLEAFLSRGHQCTGVDLAEGKIELGRSRQSNFIESGQLRLECADVLAPGVKESLGAPFDVIVLKDVIEHIPDQESFIPQLKSLLSSDGVIFFGFPPWQMPFGGHQQMITNKFLSRVPYIHLLPLKVYMWLLKMSGEKEKKRNSLAFHVKTGISIERFEKCVRLAPDLDLAHKTHFLFNPIYSLKFGLPTLTQLPILRSIPWLRNFFTTCVYYLVK